MLAAPATLSKRVKPNICQSRLRLLLKLALRRVVKKPALAA